MKILVIGKGGREHALAHAVSRSGRVKKIHAAPGSPGMAESAECVNVADSDMKGLTAFAKEQEIDLAIVGPEATLSLGIAGTFRVEGLKIFGLIKDAAQIKSSKDSAKKTTTKYGIPTASYQTSNNKADAIGYVEHQSIPAAIKEGGLETGKGVAVAYKLEEALDVIGIAFSVPGNHIVIEECLEDFESFLICFVCDDLVLPMEVTQDHKMAYDGDKGPDTGGIGVYSPVKRITPNIAEGTMNVVVMSMAKAMIRKGHSFTGFLYDRLMLTKHGAKTIEFNARFNDPKAEVTLPRLRTGFRDAIENVTNHSKTELEWNDRITLGVVMVSEGYSAFSTKGAVIENSESVDSMVFHMGTAEKEGSLVTDGGRALCICTAADTLEEAYEKAYVDVHRIHCDKLFYRDDIGRKDI